MNGVRAGAYDRIRDGEERGRGREKGRDDDRGARSETAGSK